MSNAYKPKWNFNRACVLRMAERAEAEYKDEPDLAMLDSRTEDFWLWREDETEHSIVILPDYNLVTYRGTKLDKSLKDLKEDASINREPIKGEAPGRFHRGFMDALDNSIDYTLERITDGRPTFLIGHSKGAGNATALAVRCASERLPVNVAGIITYGSPRTMGSKAAKWFEQEYGDRTLRLVNNCDMVPRVPFSNILRKNGGYKHVGEHIHLDWDGSVIIDPTYWQVVKDRIRGRLEALTDTDPSIEEIPGLTKGERNHLITGGLETLTKVASASFIKLVAGVGSVSSASLVLSWVTNRLAGVSLDNIKDAVFDGTHDHGISEYIRVLKMGDVSGSVDPDILIGL